MIVKELIKTMETDTADSDCHTLGNVIESYIKMLVSIYPEKKNLYGHRIGKFGKFKIAEVDAWVYSGEAADRNSL